MMTYSSRFVLCVLVNGHPVKELANGTVKVPFGCDYALRLRNKNNRRALVKISNDGENVSAGGYIIPANDYIDIERWADKPVKFKFVSLESEEAIDFGKNGPNEDKVKGTIEARFHLEKEATAWPIYHHYTYPPYSPPIWYTSNPPGTVCDSMPVTSSGTNYSSPNIRHMFRRKYTTKGPSAQSAGEQKLCGQSMNFCDSEQLSLASSNQLTPVMDGCTVEGNYSSQSFHTVYFDAETDYVALKLFLQGFDEKVAVARPHRETGKSRKLRELEEENTRLKNELHEQEQNCEAEAIRLLEEENKKLRDKTTIC